LVAPLLCRSELAFVSHPVILHEGSTYPEVVLPCRPLGVVEMDQDGSKGKRERNVDTVRTLLFAVAAGGGTLAQFYHPELGGNGEFRHAKR
jgi:hypothetical protein